jgi:DNA-directed RNA polymerase specialized sigma24 family protein
VTRPERTKWTLSRRAFDQLLESLAPERETAGHAYERLRNRLVKFFAWERCAEPETCADETLNRIARTLERGEVIRKMDQYALGVARLVLLEARTQERKLATAAAHASSTPAALNDEQALTCLEQCLDALSQAQRGLLVDYYRGSGKSRIQNRRRIAEELGIDLNALRNRAMRLRERVEACVRQRLNGSVS